MELCNDIKYEILFKMDEYNLVKIAYISDNDTQELILYRIKKNKKLGQKCIISERNMMCNVYARNGELEMLKCVYEYMAKSDPSRHTWDWYICENAAEYGQIECLKYSHKAGCPWSIYTSYLAGQRGHVECLKYIYKNGGICSKDMIKMYNLKL
jgi:hypothetical protein